MVLGALLGAFLFILSLQASLAWGQGEDAGVKPRLIVTYKEEATEEAEDGAVGSVEVEAEKEIPAVNAEVVSVPEARSGDLPESLQRTKEKLEEEPGVATVEYDHAREASFTPDDPGLPDQWGLKKTGFRAAWDATRGGGARIAVVDSGVAAGHPDLSGKVVAQRDFVNEDGIADDDLGHGTHVAGIAAARTGNGTGISGGCPGCELLVAKTMQGRIGYDSDVAEGIIWAADNGADVINLSLTGPAPSDILRRAVNYAWDKGAVVVAAAGNSGDGTVQYPAAYRNAIAVAATNRSDDRASFSTMGDWVDVSAPGVGILSTLPGGYGYMGGTSMATPHVAALAGLLADRGLSNQQIRDRIVSSTVDLGPDGRDPYFGAGRMDAARALRVSATQPDPTPEPAPKEQPNAPADKGGDNQRTLASDEKPQPREDPAPPPPEKPEPRPAPVAKVEQPAAEPTTEEPAPEPVAEPAPEPAEKPKPTVREAPPEPPPTVQAKAPLPQAPPRELVFQDDEELEDKFRQAEMAEQAAVQPAGEEGCAPTAASPAGDKPEVGLVTAMVDGALSTVRSMLEGLGLVSTAEAEQEATGYTSCTNTAERASESYSDLN